MKKVKFKDLSQEEQVLVKLAERARENAFCPYSKYKVGAALKTENGKFYSGCNVESAIYQTTHAEKNAIDSMVADGGRKIVALCCMAENGGIPCAECRQFIWEFSGGNRTLKIIGVDSKRNITISTIGELYPRPFGPWDLGIDPEKY